jgi:hypothetical protein
MNVVLIAVLLLALVILAANTLLAVAFLRDRKGGFRSLRGHGDDALEELHKRVQELPEKRE